MRNNSLGGYCIGGWCFLFYGFMNCELPQCTEKLHFTYSLDIARSARSRARTLPAHPAPRGARGSLSGDPPPSAALRAINVKPHETRFSRERAVAGARAVLALAHDHKRPKSRTHKTNTFISHALLSRTTLEWYTAHQGTKSVVNSTLHGNLHGVLSRSLLDS